VRNIKRRTALTPIFLSWTKRFLSWTRSSGIWSIHVQICSFIGVQF
jgi:hypothetical protein